MESIAVGWHNIPEAGNAWAEYFALRNEEFVNVKGWDLPSVEGAEFDWYDRPGARWIIITQDGECVGGSRIISTASPSYGDESYMLKDAQLGRLTGIPFDLLPPDLPSDPTVFEATRFFVKRTLGPKTTMRVQKEIVRKTVETVQALGGTEVIALMPCRIFKLFRSFGFDVVEHPESRHIDGISHSVGRIYVA